VVAVVVAEDLLNYADADALVERGSRKHVIRLAHGLHSVTNGAASRPCSLREPGGDGAGRLLGRQVAGDAVDVRAVVNEIVLD